MKHFVGWGMVAMLSLVGAAASAQVSPAPPAQPERFAHSVSDSTVVLTWNCTKPEPGVLHVQGVVRNPWYATPVTNLNFQLFGVNDKDQDISRTVGTPRDYMIRSYGPSPFALDLKLSGEEQRFDLVYYYWLGPGGGGFGKDEGRPGTVQNLARDICEQHTNRNDM
jgi:hypothetical protein